MYIKLCQNTCYEKMFKLVQHKCMEITQRIFIGILGKNDIILTDSIFNVISPRPDTPCCRICNTQLKMINHPLQSNTQHSSKCHTTLFKVTHNNLQSTTPPSSKYHTTLLQRTTSPSSNYHTNLFKVPHNILQSTTPPSSKYHTTRFKVPLHPLQSTTPPSSKCIPMDEHDA